MAGSLRQLIPDDHVLVRVDAVLDLSWLRGEIADLYCPDNGRPGIDPEVAVRLMLAGFLLGIVHDRRVMREAAVNIAIRWFVGYGVHEALPDHSSLTRIRQRWSAQRFRQIFERTVQACIAAKIATGKVVHIDASLIRAHVSWEALAVRHIEAVAEADEELRDGRQGGTLKKVCVTDPDATMATYGRNRRLEPAYKQHTAVDDVAGVIVDVEVATGQENEGMAVASRLDAIVATTGKSIAIATMDAGYAYAKVFRALEDRKIKGIVPAKAEQAPGKVIPTRRFKFDPHHNIVPSYAVQEGKYCARRASSSAAPSSIFRPVPEIVAAVRCDPDASALRAIPAWSSSISTMLRCSGRGASDSIGASVKTGCISAIAGALRASMVRQRLGTASPERFGVASITCAFKPSSLPPRSI